MDILKYSTKHLVAIKAKSLLGQEHYQIFEKDAYYNDKDAEPIAIYSKYNFQLSNKISKKKWIEYFDEMSEIMTELTPIIKENHDILGR